jgi:hypothetical protein
MPTTLMQVIRLGEKKRPVIDQKLEIEEDQKESQTYLTNLLKRHNIWHGELVSYRREPKEYGFDVTLNDIRIQFVEPQFVATEDGVPPENA